MAAFVRKGNYKPVLELLGTVPGYAKMDALRALPRTKDGKVPEEAFETAWLIVDEKDEKMSRYELEYLSVNSVSL